MKDLLRKKYQEQRNQLSNKQVEEQSMAIANQLLQLDIWDKTYYHLFLPIEKKKEINTEYILQILHGKDKEVVIPKSNFETHTITSILLTDNTKILVNTYGIPEPTNGLQVPPTTIDVVFLPLLAFDQIGNRVGYGKGFYDRFLEQCRADVIKIGLSFFESELYSIETIPTDMRLDYCVTPNRIYKF